MGSTPSQLLDEGRDEESGRERRVAAAAIAEPIAGAGDAAPPEEERHQDAVMEAAVAASPELGDAAALRAANPTIRGGEGIVPLAPRANADAAGVNALAAALQSGGDATGSDAACASATGQPQPGRKGQMAEKPFVGQEGGGDELEEAADAGGIDVEMGEQCSLLQNSPLRSARGGGISGVEHSPMKSPPSHLKRAAKRNKTTGEDALAEAGDGGHGLGEGPAPPPISRSAKNTSGMLFCQAVGTPFEFEGAAEGFELNGADAVDMEHPFGEQAGVKQERRTADDDWPLCMWPETQRNDARQATARASTTRGTAASNSRGAASTTAAANPRGARAANPQPAAASATTNRGGASAQSAAARRPAIAAAGQGGTNPNTASHGANICRSGCCGTSIPSTFFGIDTEVNLDALDETFGDDPLLHLDNAMKSYEAELGYEVETGGNGAPDWIPPGLETIVYDKGTYKLDRELSVQISGGPAVGTRQHYTLRESREILGPRGIVRKAFPIYCNSRARFGRKLGRGSSLSTDPASRVEDLQTYYCPAQSDGCNVKLLISRCARGIIVHRSAEENGDKCVHTNHGGTGSGRHAGTSLTLDQKKEVLELYGVDMTANRADIADEMESLNAEQRAKPKKFKQAIGDFLKGAKRKYFMFQWHNDVMNDAQLVEALDGIMVPLGEQLQNPKPFDPPNDENEVYADANGNYFLDSGLYKTLGEKMFVLDHDYRSPDKGHILFAPRDLEERCYRAACMHSQEDEADREVQIGCDWFEVESGVQVAHAGFYDRDGVYIPCIYATAKHENAAKTEQAMAALRDALIFVTRPDYLPRKPEWNASSSLDSGAVRMGTPKVKCVSDAAEAIASACRCCGFGVCRCFSHAARMADGTKRNSKRGTQGSIFRYLRNNMKLSHKQTSKVCVDVLTANYIPPADRRDYVGWKEKMYEKHPHVFGGDTKGAKHMREFYINDDPCCLGGHCCPLAGMPASNNGGEKRGGIIKQKWKRIVRYMPKEEKKNPIYAMAACAVDLNMMASLSEFAVEPTKHESDYLPLRKISSWTPTGPGDAPADLLYMNIVGEEGNLLDSSEVIGDGTKSFVAHLPTGTNVYSNVRMSTTETARAERSGTLTEQADYLHESERADSPAKCKKILNSMTAEQVMHLKIQLYRQMLANTPGANPGERLFDFNLRRGQRNPSGAETTARTAARMKRSKKRVTKKKRKAKSKEEVAKMEDKYGKEEMATADSVVEASQQEGAASESDVELEDDDGILMCGADFDEEDLLAFLKDHWGIEVEEDGLLNRALEKSMLVRLPRQLGYWTEVKVDAKKKRVTCNCEDYNFEGYCVHCALFEVLQFQQFPGLAQSQTGERWGEIRQKCIEMLRGIYVDIGSSV